MRRRLTTVARGILGLLLLTACQPRGEGGPLPTLGPVRNGSGGRGNAIVELTASTNCAEVGEVVTLTVHLKNDSPRPITLVGTPVLEITIKPAQERLTPVQRWSQSKQYPATIEPVLAPGEERTYVWRWTADRVYAPNNGINNDIEVATATDIRETSNSYPRTFGGRVVVGITSLNLPQGALRCAAMRR